MAKDVQFQPGMEIRVKDSAFNCTKKRAQIVGRTGFGEHFLRDGRIEVHHVHDDGQIKISHPEIIGSKDKPITIHAKFFEQVQAPTSA